MFNNFYYVSQLNKINCYILTIINLESVVDR